MPDGRDTPDARLRVVIDESDRDVGSVWWAVHPRRSGAAYVFDIEIRQEARGSGYGRAAMQAVEAAAGFIAIGLSVSGDNGVARHLYDSLGYQTQSIAMLKTFTGPGTDAGSTTNVQRP